MLFGIFITFYSNQSENKIHAEEVLTLTKGQQFWPVACAKRSYTGDNFCKVPVLKSSK
jgi:hypothetical protein